GGPYWRIRQRCSVFVDWPMIAAASSWSIVSKSPSLFLRTRRIELGRPRLSFGHFANNSASFMLISESNDGSALDTTGTAVGVLALRRITGINGTPFRGGLDHRQGVGLQLLAAVQEPSVAPAGVSRSGAWEFRRCERLRKLCCVPRPISWQLPQP